MRTQLVRVLIASAMVLMTGVSLEAATLYGITFQDQLITINTSTASSTLVGTVPAGMNSIGLGSTGGRLYTFDQTADRIRELNPADGSLLSTVDIGVAGTGEGALTFRSDGIGFMSFSGGATGTLYSFDLSIPSSTQITLPGRLSPSMDGMDFDGSNVLYGISQGGTALYTIDPSNGATTLIGSTGLTAPYILGGLAIAPNGTIYAALAEGSNSPSFLYTLNKNTGAATLVGNIGRPGISGLDFYSSSVPEVPEPSTYALIGSGLGLLCWLRRRA